MLFKNDVSWDFPGGPAVKTLSWHCRRQGFLPGHGTKILGAWQCSPPPPKKNISFLHNISIKLFLPEKYLSDADAGSLTSHTVA